MRLVLLIRLLLSAIAILCFARVCWDVISDQPTNELPFSVEQPAQGQSYVVRARPDIALPPPLAAGEGVALSEMLPADRAAVVFNSQSIPAGTGVTLVLIRNGQHVRAAVTAIAVPPKRLERLAGSTVGVIDLTFLLAVALLTLWRGRDWSAWGLFVVAFRVLLGNGLGFPASPQAQLWLDPVRSVTLVLGTGPALYLMAESLAGGGLSPRSRRLLRLAVSGLTLTLLAITMTRYGLATYAGIPGPPWMAAAGGALLVALVALAPAVLFVGYHRATLENRLRIRWVLLSTGLLLACIAALVVVQDTNNIYLLLLFNNVGGGLAWLGYLYAILRARVVDVAFVIDRAVVFSLITAILFGLFSLLEQVLHRFAVGEQLGWILQALTAVGIAAALSSVHRWLDRALEGVFFHKLRKMVSALRGFTAESAFFETEPALLSRALKQLLAPCSAVAIYERDGVIYRRREAHGDWPERVDVDDPLFVALRARRQELGIKSVGGSIGGEGTMFPMMVGQMLTGAVVCRPRDGEQLDRDMRSAIAELARSLGTSLYLLRFREQARLIAEIAAGHVDQAAARSRAAALMVAP
jgi:hypothetical protein